MESNMHEGEKSGAKYRLKDCQYPCPFACPDVSRPTGTSLWYGKKEEEDQKRRDSRSESLFAKYVRGERGRNHRRKASSSGIRRAFDSKGR